MHCERIICGMRTNKELIEQKRRHDLYYNFLHQIWRILKDPRSNSINEPQKWITSDLWEATKYFCGHQTLALTTK